jgi:hypothetical protein
MAQDFKLVAGEFGLVQNPETHEVVLQTHEFNLYIPSHLLSQLGVKLLDATPLAIK